MLIQYFKTFLIKSSESGLYFILIVHLSLNPVNFKCSVATCSKWVYGTEAAAIRKFPITPSSVSFLSTILMLLKERDICYTPYLNPHLLVLSVLHDAKPIGKDWWVWPRLWATTLADLAIEWGLRISFS